MEFVSFGKTPRLTAPVIISEKLDGTNAQIHIQEIVSEEEYRALDHDPTVLVVSNSHSSGGMPLVLRAGSRNRYLTLQNDNFGFASWVYRKADELFLLGPGRHYGEWYGQGIQRGYGMDDRCFALFVPEAAEGVPECVETVYRFLAGTSPAEAMSVLHACGSRHVRGYRRPEGIIVYHTASKQRYKQTFEHDDGKWKENK